jgi:hypothetical protein
VSELALPGICAVAFLVVFVVLAGLALLIQAISLAFPPRTSRTDPAVVAAIHAAVAALYPHARVTRIEEER